MHWILVVGLWCVTAVAGAAGQTFAYEVISVSDGGSIVGTIQYSGPRPAVEPLAISKDQEVCGKTKKVDETLLIGEHQGVQNAVVSLIDITKGKQFAQKNVILDQKECRYAPHVLLVPVNSELSILNNDGILHNFHSLSTKNPIINKPQPKFKKVMKEKFSNPEVIKVVCDAHAWMSGWLIITEHPYYAISDGQGKFLLEGIPPGEFTLKIWHEVLKETTQKIRVAPSERQEIVIELKNEQGLKRNFSYFDYSQNMSFQ